MSLRARRIARRERRAVARRAKLTRLRQGTNLRARPAWATVIQAFAFVRKELGEILRQPKLLILLVFGPFLLLLVFGAGYRDATIGLRTEFVGPPGSVYEQVVNDYGDVIGDYIDPMGFSNDTAAALARLDAGEIDAVVAFPDDALDQVLGGERARIEVFHEQLNPFQQTAIDIAARLAVQEVNASILGAITASAQEALAPVDEMAAVLTERAAALTDAVAAQDPAAMADTAADVRATLGDLRLVIATSRDLVQRLGADDQTAPAADVLEQLDAAAADADAITAGTDEDIAARATTLSASLVEVAEAIPSVTTLDPDVLVRPFEATTENVAAIDIRPVDFFAPSSIMLLLQHMALTLAALSLVRDRQLGLFELLRVGPLSSLEILVGKTIAYITVGFAVGAALVAGAVAVLDVPLQGELIWLAAVVALVLLASLTLGMVLSMISGSETQAVQYAMLTLLAGMFFSGFFLDATELAMPYRILSYALPVTYGINAVQDVMLRGIEPSNADLLGLGALILIYGTAAVLLLRRRLRVG
jgi:ABC-2 type transport system permease protein